MPGQPPPPAPAKPANPPLKVLELYAGLGGCAAALASLSDPGEHPEQRKLSSSATVVAAVDISELALSVYQHNFPSHRTKVAAVESVQREQLQSWDADLWWMSPPCQPYTRRGLRRELADPRGQSFLPVIEQLRALQPSMVALENVPGFEVSETRRLLLQALAECGYQVSEGLLCPTELGWPNRRRRYYLLALHPRRSGTLPPSLGVQPDLDRREGQTPQPLASFLDPDLDPELLVGDQLLADYHGALDLVQVDDPQALTACFTSAYGRSPVRSGSYLQGADGKVRRFSPNEILRLLGFPGSYTLPPQLSREQAWRLAGNSLSLPAVRRVLSFLPWSG